jgi:signal transduction histidine kinase
MAATASRSLTRHAILRLLPGLVVLTLVQAVLGYVLVARPLLERSADRFAAMLAEAAASDTTLPGVRWELAQPQHGRVSWLPFNRYLLRSARRLGAQADAVRVAADGDYVLHWSPQRGDAHISADTVIGARPVAAIYGWLLSTLMAAALAAWLLAGSLMRPLQGLRDDLELRIRTLGQSASPTPSLSIIELDSLRQDVARLCERLRQALDDRTVLLLGLSHELRGPLARLSLREPVDEGMQADIAEMRDTLQQFLAAADVMGSPGRRQVSPQALIAELAARYAQNPALSFAGDPGRTRLLNTVAFMRIACNLLDNTQRHAPQARVQCRLRITSEVWTLEVQDDGPGLSDQRKLQPFAPFAPGRSGGLGLGLALSRLLAEQNGWTLSLCAANPRGLYARLSMPVDSAPF